LQRWSQYLDEHDNRPQDAAQLPITPLSNAQIDTSGFAFKDVIALQGGVQWRYLPGWEASVGSAWYPSPVPAQTGRTNYADGDLIGVTLGQRHDFQIAKRRFVAAIAVQAWRLLPRMVYKNASQMVDEFPDGAKTLEGGRPMPESQGLQTNNPGFPGYTSDGWMGTATLNLSYLF
jgi:hypothetical protein